MIFYKIHNLTKIFNTNILFENAEFEAKIGDTCLIMGENGIGKSTLLKIIGNIESFNKGKIDSNVNKIAILTEKDWLYSNLTVKENLEFWASLENKKIDSKLINIFNLEKYLDVKLEKSSQGIRRRTALIRIFQKNANMILLDEPYTYLDRVGIAILNDYIESIQDEKIILIASHDIEKSIRIFNRIDLIREKKIILDIKNVKVELK